MLELPESCTISKQIKETLKGRIIKKVTVGKKPHKFAFYSQDKDYYESVLIGQSVTDAVYRGAIVEIDTEDFMLYFSDGAYPRLYGNPKLFPETHQFLAEFEDGSALGVSVQMYGYIGLSPLGKCEQTYYLTSVNRLNPLQKEFSYEYFSDLRNLSGKKLSAKAFLATEQRIPGIGNGVLQDILWNAEIDPKRNVASLSEGELYKLYDSTVSTPAEMTKLGGRNTERDFFGNKGGYVCLLSKDTVGLPCVKCGQPIKKANYMGGTGYFCEICQKKQV